jgi:serine/threonine protein kinase
VSLLFVTAAATVTPQVLKESVKEWERQQFAAEYEMLLRVSHPNILRLLAFSNDGPHRCLVMELCVGGSLDRRLACQPTAASEPAPAPLQWAHRVKLAVEVARAIVHLHSLVPCMVHRDLKVRANQHPYAALCNYSRCLRLTRLLCPQTANILLDRSGSAKVADFGTVREGAKKGVIDSTHASTRLVVGTKGYM